MTYRILAIDGGGIRGLLPAVVLQRLAAVPRLEGWLDRVDLLAGTSSGGILALALARGIGLDALRALFEDKGSQIFDDSWLDDVVDLGRLGGAQYDDRNLRRELRRAFGEITLSRLAKRVLVPAFDLDNEAPDPARRTWKPKLFHNFPGPDSDGGRKAWQVALYTSAAPTYFPSVDGYVDGGVYAPNPSLCALAQTRDRRVRPRPRLDDVVLLSLGTGRSLVHVRGRRHDWGTAQWAPRLVRLLLDGVSGIADYQCARLLGRRYHRVDTVFPPGLDVPLDGVGRIPELVRTAEELDLAATVRWLRRYWWPER